MGAWEHGNLGTGGGGTGAMDGSEALSEERIALVRDQLDRVLGSVAFSGSDRLSRLLRFTVLETLEGRGDRLKEYVLGLEVFDRGNDYDPRIDSIVRVEARRLRSKLAEYYEGEGVDDRVRFRYRKGSYSPRFEVKESRGARPAERSSSGAMRLWLLASLVTVAIVLAGWVIVRTSGSTAAATPARIAVLPLEHYSGLEAGDQALADRLTDGITTELARMSGVAVLSRTSARQFDRKGAGLRELSASLGVVYLMEGTVFTAGGRVRVSARLVDAELDRKIWVEDFESDASPEQLDLLPRRIAIRIAEVANSKDRAR
jgi:TolB-like protein